MTPINPQNSRSLNLVDKYLNRFNIQDPRKLKYAGMNPKREEKLNLFDPTQNFAVGTNFHFKNQALFKKNYNSFIIGSRSKRGPDGRILNSSVNISLDTSKGDNQKDFTNNKIYKSYDQSPEKGYKSSRVRPIIHEANNIFVDNRARSLQFSDY